MESFHFRALNSEKNTLGVIVCHFSAVIKPTHRQTFKDLAVLSVSVKTLGRIHPAQPGNLEIGYNFST